MLSANFYSFVIAQVFGMYLVVMAIILASRGTYYRSVLADLDARRLPILSNASVWLLIGLFILLIHNFWIWQPHVLLVTILGWLIVIKSVMWLAAPESMAKMTRRCYSGAGYYIKVAIMAIYGVALLSKGFYFYIVQVSAS
jgi:hypothetical protein